MFNPCDERFEDGDTSTGTVADYEDWIGKDGESQWLPLTKPRQPVVRYGGYMRLPNPTRFELHGMRRYHTTTLSATEARRWIAQGRRLSAMTTGVRDPLGTFGRYVIRVRPNPDGDPPFKTTIYPKEYRS